MCSKTLLAFCLVFQFGYAQMDWELDTAFETNATQVYADHLGNVYLTEKWTIVKHSAEFDETFVHNNPGLGNINFVNTFNPFNVLLYYPDYNQFVFLDNKMNSNLNAFEPSNVGYYDVQLSATFDENDIWFYDQVTDKLYKWSLTQSKELSSSLQIGQLSGSDSRPNYMWATLKNVYVNVPEIGVLVFDNFGSYKSTIPIKGLSEFYFSESALVFFTEGEMEVFNYFTKASKKVELPEKGFDDLYFSEGKLYLLKGGQLKIFTRVK